MTRTNALEKQLRKTKRRQLGKLSNLKVQPRTQKRYDFACKWFFTVCRLRWQRLPWDSRSLDRGASVFIEYLWEEGEPRQVVADLLSGLSAKLNVKCFTGAWKLYATWLRREPASRSLPLLEEQVCGFAAYWAIDKKDLRYGVLLLLGFYCFLRTTELIMLVRSDIRFSLGDGTILVSLRLSKTGKRLGVDEGITICNRKLAFLLHLAFDSLLPTERLTSCSDAEFRAKFAETCTFFNLSTDTYKPYSLRRGGATRHFQQYRNWQLTQSLGRWQSASSCRIYVQEALASLTKLNASVQQRLKWTRYAHVLYSITNGCSS